MEQDTLTNIQGQLADDVEHVLAEDVGIISTLR